LKASYRSEALTESHQGDFRLDLGREAFVGFGFVDDDGGHAVNRGGVHVSEAAAAAAAPARRQGPDILVAEFGSSSGLQSPRTSSAAVFLLFVAKNSASSSSGKPSVSQRDFR